MKSVLHIGISAPTFSPRGIEKGLKGAGFEEYHFVDWQQIRFSEGILGCQSRMIQAAKSIMPDLIFCHFQNSDILDEETVVELSKCGFTVNYTFDVRDAERTQWLYDLAPYFGLTIFACLDDVEEAKRRGIENVGYMHSSCDIEQYRPLDLPKHTMGQYPEIVFIGNNYVNTNLNFPLAKEREEMVNFMQQEFGDRFEARGMGWGPYSKLYNQIEETNAYNSCNLSITHNHFQRKGYCSDRQWKSMACGLPTIIQYYDGCHEDFIESPSCIWKSFDELSSLCRKYLFDKDARIELSNYQRKKFLSHHTWVHRFIKMKEIINGILGKQIIGKY